MQHDFDINKADANTGIAVRAEINAALQALATNNAGATEPAVPYAHMWWADTANDLLKKRNADNTAWIEEGTLGAINLGMVGLGYNTYPVLLEWAQPAPGAGLTKTIPAATALFNGKKVTGVETSNTFTASKITDVYLDDDGSLFYEECALDDYVSMTLYPEKCFLCRVQTDATDVKGTYFGGNFYEVKKRAAIKAMTTNTLVDQYVVPSNATAWAEKAVVRGDNLVTPDGDIYTVTQEGTTSATPPETPVYSNNGSSSGFGEQYNGSAIVVFKGTAGHEGCWTQSANGGMVSWYFPAIAAGLLADRIPTASKAFLLAMAKHIIADWVSGVTYQQGMKIGGTHTNGTIWQATTTGITGAYDTVFTADPELGVTTVVDGTVTWRAVGSIAADPAPQFFWAVTDPVQRLYLNTDANDSDAACFLWAAWRYINATNDYAWLTDDSPVPNHTYIALMAAAAYNNLALQLDGTCGLIKTFQNDTRIDGSEYAARFLMDNCENYAGLIALARIYQDYLSNAEQAAYYNGIAASVLAGIKALYQANAKAFKWELAADMSDIPVNKSFYPHGMAQLWPALWGIPLHPTYLDECIEYANQISPHWWARNDSISLATVGPAIGLIIANGAYLYRNEVLRRAEIGHLLEGYGESWIISDAAFYLYLRDSAYVKHLLEGF